MTSPTGFDYNCDNQKQQNLLFTAASSGAQVWTFKKQREIMERNLTTNKID